MPSAGTAALLFYVYAGILGVSLATIFIVYTANSIANVFFISAAAFGALSLYGYTTKRDLSPIGSFLIMGLFGLIIASLPTGTSAVGYRRAAGCAGREKPPPSREGW